MIKFFTKAKSWYATKRLEQKEHFWNRDTPTESLRLGLIYDDQEHIDYALTKLASGETSALADDQKTLLNLISTCAEFSSPKNLEILISFWSGKHQGLDRQNRTPVHAVLGNKRYAKVELWNLLLKIFAVDQPRYDGITALADASSMGSLEDINVLIQLGANPLANFNSTYTGLDPLSFALFFNEDRAVFQSLYKLAGNTKYTESELLTLLLFNVCAYPFHAGEYPGKKRISDLRYLVSLGASFADRPENQYDSALLRLEPLEFESLIDEVLTVAESGGFKLADNPIEVVHFISRGCWRNRPRVIGVLFKHGVNFNDGYEVHWRDSIQPIWFGVLHFSFSQPADWTNVLKALLECGVTLELKDSFGRSFCHYPILPGETKSDRYNVLNQLKSLGLSEELYSAGLQELEADSGISH